MTEKKVIELVTNMISLDLLIALNLWLSVLVIKLYKSLQYTQQASKRPQDLLIALQKCNTSKF